MSSRSRTTIGLGVAAATIVLVVVVAAVVATSGGEDEGSGTSASHGDMVMTPSGDEDGGMLVWQDVTDPAVRDRLAADLVAARAAAERFPTTQAATDAGFEQVEATEPGTGTRWERPELVDATFDPAEPEALLFDGDGPDARLAGLAYVVTSGEGERAPDGFPGPNDQWHQVGDDRRMLHVWVVPGWENPLGPFSATHPDLA